MSEDYFAFKKRPFLSLPKTETYFPAESIENARKTVISVLERDTGIPLIFGKNGTGKSLLLKQIGKHFEFDHSVVYIANPGLKTPKALFQQILHGIQQPYCSLDENELRLILKNYLQQFETPEILLLIDEAQTLSRKVLEELRILLDCSHENRSNIQIVLAGTGAFEEKLTHPKLSAFQQHVTARCYLMPFTWDETENYITWQMQQAGVSDPNSVFTREAGKLLHKLTEGFPRLINQLGEEALFLAQSMRRNTVDEDMVREAWGILQQLPVEKPIEKDVCLSEPPAMESLEFGELSDNNDLGDFCKTGDFEVLEKNGVSLPQEPLLDLENEETVILKITDNVANPQNAPTMPCEDFLQKIRVMEATIVQDFSKKNRLGTAKDPISRISNITAQKPTFFYTAERQ